MRKRALRARVLAARDEMSEQARRTASAAIERLVLNHPRYRSAHCVAAYSSFGSEFGTAVFTEDALVCGRRLLMPRVDRGSRALVFHQVTDLVADLKPGVWGIREPDPDRCPIAELSAVDFMLVPGVAFTPRCERLGYGGGFYDTVIAKLPPGAFKAAAAFSLQIVDVIPTDSWDRRVDAVVTEHGQYSQPG